MHGEQIWPVGSNLPQLGHGLVEVIDPASASVTGCYGGDLRPQNLVGSAHRPADSSRPLPPVVPEPYLGKRTFSRPYGRPWLFDLFES